MDNHHLFENTGLIIFKNFIKDPEFYEICTNLKRDILIEFENTDKKNLGGFQMGNLAVTTTKKYNKLIYDILIQNGLEKIIKEITNNKFSDYQITMGGNLNIPGGYTQHFHTDGILENKFIIVNIATEDVYENNGPLEIFCNTHKTKLPYWKFLLKKKNTLKFLASKGDILIRKSELWHRGLKNTSNNARFMFGINLIKKNNPNNQNLFKVDEDLKIGSNFFKATFFGKIEEKIYCKFRLLYILVRLLKSFFQ